MAPLDVWAMGQCVRLEELKTTSLNHCVGAIAGPLENGRYPVIFPPGSPAAKLYPGGTPEHIVPICNLSVETRRKLCRQAVKSFTHALERDMYPEESLERVFGVEMPAQGQPNGQDQIGAVVYGAWTGLRKSFFELRIRTWWIDEKDDPEPISHQEQLDNQACVARLEWEHDLVNALMEGHLPACFKAMVIEQLADPYEKLNSVFGIYGLGPTNGCVANMMSRGFESINWDKQMHAYTFSGQCFRG